MPIAIRTVRDADAASIVGLLNPIVEAGTLTIMTEPVTLEGQLAYIRGFPERGVFHVAVNDANAIVAIQSVEPVSPEPALHHVGDVSTFVAAPEQGRGIGRRLAETTFDSARAVGFRKLMATIRTDNPSAIAFYRTLGFEIVGIARAHVYVRGMYVDEMITERAL